MRFESSVVSITWIPSEAVRGLTRLTFETGVTHYDQPPPAEVHDLEALRSHDGFRFANELAAWIEVEDGRIVDFGQAGEAHMGSTTVRIGKLHKTFAGVTFPTLRPPPEVGDGWVRFTQTAGGRTALPFPRLVAHAPFVQLRPPTAWTTLSLTLHADGRVERELSGASPFPRHWVYDADGRLVAKSGVNRFGRWARHATRRRSPWHHVEHRPRMSAVETPVERQLSGEIMQGGRTIRRLRAGQLLIDQGGTGDEVFLVLDGVLRVEVDGREVGEVGPGAVVGERAVVEGGARTATLRAVTPVRVAVTTGTRLGQPALAAVVDVHRREEALV